MLFLNDRLWSQQLQMDFYNRYWLVFLHANIIAPWSYSFRNSHCGSLSSWLKSLHIGCFLFSRLCAPQPTDIIVDPMCGTGAIPIEVITFISFQISKWYVRNVLELTRKLYIMKSPRLGQWTQEFWKKYSSKAGTFV